MATDLGQFLGGGGGAIEVSQLGNGTGSSNSMGAGLYVSGGNTSYASVLSVSGSGYYTSHIFQIGPGFNQDATSGCRVIIDGTTILTTPNVTVANGGATQYHCIWPFSMADSGAAQAGGIPIKFNTSLTIQHYHTGGFGCQSYVGYVLD